MLSKAQKISVYSVLPPLRLGEPFGKLSKSAKESFERLSAPHEFSKGDVIFDRNSEPASVWLAVSGRAGLCYPAGNDGVNASQPIAANDVCGLTETLARVPYQATLRAASSCTFRSLSYIGLTQFLRDEPALCAALLENLAQDYYQGYLKLLSRS
jgi:CRP-like cAMP-binding protein